MDDSSRDSAASPRSAADWPAGVFIKGFDECKQNSNHWALGLPNLIGDKPRLIDSELVSYSLFALLDYITTACGR